MGDHARAIDEKDTVRNRLQQRGIFLFAEPQIDDGARAAQHVADSVHQQRPVDGLDDEVRCAGLVGPIDGPGIVAAGDHDDGQVGAAGQGADVGAGLVAVAAGHLDVEQSDVRKPQRARRDRRVAAGHALHVEAAPRSRAPAISRRMASSSAMSNRIGAALVVMRTCA